MYELNWDKVVEQYGGPDTADGLNNSFNIRGQGMWGGCQDVQTKLGEYGVCRFVRWDPRPPYWSFFYDTNLSKRQIITVLGYAKERWQVHID